MLVPRAQREGVARFWLKVRQSHIPLCLSFRCVSPLLIGLTRAIQENRGGR